MSFQEKVMEQTAADFARQMGPHARALQQAAADMALQRKEIANLLAVSGRRTAELLSSLDRRNAELSTTLARVQSDGDEKIDQMEVSFGQQLAGAAEDVLKLRSGVDQLSESLRRTQLQGRLRDRDFRRFVHDVRGGEIESSARETAAPVPPMFPSKIGRAAEFDYFAFEDRYRGEEAMIRRRQQEYLRYFGGRDNVLDVGCGRGEFLELLREQNISAKGVELGTDQYLICKEKDLDVVQQDLFSYLESLPDESLGGLFSAQVIEHLAAGDQLRFITLAHRKTSPGSPVIFETINAQCVWAVMRNFFLDPTHVRPVHPETLKFAMESANFQNVVLVFSSPVSDHFIPPLEVDGEVRNLQEFNRQLEHLNELLYGNQDYAAVGWR
ncbi:MAG TPA: class I SAM-dependent methyltransferase [Candidatus Angelobacter sp.]|nr:class I SAM-dependent methyltransferase [Candidatus Angelobacter sp.]